MADLSNKKVAVLVDNYFEEAEFTGPIKAMKDQGAMVDIISTDSKDLQGMNHTELADKFKADHMIDEVNIDDYDALILPGGAVNADHLRMNDKARMWAQKFMAAGKPLAAICHAPWLLASAGITRGKKLTSFFTIQDDMRNAGADWVDKEVVIDDNLITSRQPEDVPAFTHAITTMLTA